MEAAKIMNTFFEIQTTLKFSHWKTQSYSKHKALDKFLKEFIKKMDEFIEMWQGKYGRIKYSNKTGNHSENIKVYQIDDENLQRYLDCVLGFLSGDKIKNCNKYCKITLMDIIQKKDTDLLNLRDEIIGLVNHLKYLLTLL